MARRRTRMTGSFPGRRLGGGLHGREGTAPGEEWCPKGEAIPRWSEFTSLVRRRKTRRENQGREAATQRGPGATPHSRVVAAGISGPGDWWHAHGPAWRRHTSAPGLRPGGERSLPSSGPFAGAPPDSRARCLLRRGVVGFAGAASDSPGRGRVRWRDVLFVGALLDSVAHRRVCWRVVGCAAAMSPALRRCFLRWDAVAGDAGGSLTSVVRQGSRAGGSPGARLSSPGRRRPEARAWEHSLVGDGPRRSGKERTPCVERSCC